MGARQTEECLFPDISMQEQEWDEKLKRAAMSNWQSDSGKCSGGFTKVFY